MLDPKALRARANELDADLPGCASIGAAHAPHPDDSRRPLCDEAGMPMMLIMSPFDATTEAPCPACLRKLADRIEGAGGVHGDGGTMSTSEKRPLHPRVAAMAPGEAARLWERLKKVNDDPPIPDEGVDDPASSPPAIGTWVKRLDDGRVGKVASIATPGGWNPSCLMFVGDVEVRVSAGTSIVTSGRDFWTRWEPTEGPPPTIHVHACPECLEYERCEQDCTIEPDLGEHSSGLPMGSHCRCSKCEAASAQEEGRES